MLPGAEILIKCLEKEDVNLIFGYPGGAALDIFDALEKSRQIRHVLVRHEQGAAHAANGYARASGKVGVCIATSGPGATNLVTGIATAYMDSVPLVVITGQVPTSMIGTDAFQEVDITGITDPITKHNYLVKDARDIPRIVQEAFYIAGSGRPGPVLIDLPKDVAGCRIEPPEEKPVDLRGYKPKVTGHAGQIKQISELLQEAKRPLICAGGGVISAGASKELIELAQTLQAPVVNTLMGVGSIPLSHPLALGMLGTYGLAQANLAVQACDLFLALGMRFTDRVTGNVAKFAPEAKIVHIDIDTAEIGKNVRVDVPLVGDLKIVLNQLNSRLQKKKNPEWAAKIAQIRENCRMMREMNPEKDGAECISPRDVMTLLNEKLPPSSIVTTDVGQHQIWAAQMYRAGKPRTFISSGGLGTMGYGIPAAVGAQLACPDCPVVVITGDGSFQMGLPELGTAYEQDLPLKIIVFNNQALGMVKQLQDHYCGGRHVAVHFSKLPDFHHLALAYRALSLKATNKDELADKMTRFLEHEGLAIMEIAVSCRDNVYPMVLAGCGLDELVGLE
ncbi:MAG: biosynthetic-type acetolactate synthase large subunit [Peptococcaceae bacterium]|jgi:acetolactate synthase-1/2/3 large subunit|nr:biosynthetic-type acetolactate synthase large subunit [Peptococcaceae bacterium]MDH7524711.1 biosynthetic-type acetolactate synthase large subunit [Peptococcaceae bacterium]